MKNALLRSAFLLSVLLLWLLLLSIALGGIEIFFPVRRRPDGLYPNTDRTPLVVIGMGGSAWVANQAISRLFAAAGWSKVRWSVFNGWRR